jgi:hypothetical protein
MKDSINWDVDAIKKGGRNIYIIHLQEAQEEYDQHRQEDRQLIDEQVRTQIMALTTDFPRVWNDPHTNDRDRKRLLRLMVEDVTLIKTHEVTLHVRFRGGATQTLAIPAARPPWQTYVTAPEVVQMIDSLLNQSADEQVAAILNQRGLHPGKGESSEAGSSPICGGSMV